MIWVLVGFTAVLLLAAVADVRGHDYQPGDWQWLAPALCVKPGLFIAAIWGIYFTVSQ